MFASCRDKFLSMVMDSGLLAWNGVGIPNSARLQPSRNSAIIPPTGLRFQSPQDDAVISPVEVLFKRIRSVLVTGRMSSSISFVEGELICQGAEGKVFSTTYLGQPAVCKVRLQKRYRVSELDDRINRQRLLQEARCIAKCKRFGISAPW
jgi:hypothetical protein